MWKHKGDKRKQTLETKIYPVVRLGTKPLILHLTEALYQEYRFSVTKSLLGLFFVLNDVYMSRSRCGSNHSKKRDAGKWNTQKAKKLKLDSPAMGSRSKTTYPSSSTMSTRSKEGSVYEWVLICLVLVVLCLRNYAVM